jgi:RNA polymerase sigma-70 factor (ECF subfamily)
MSEKVQLKPEQWVAAHADYLYAFAFLRIAEPELCKDLVQDTFMSAIKNHGSFKGNSSERTWLTAILKNKIIDLFRKRAAELLISDMADKEPFDSFFETNGHWKHKHEPQSWGMEEVNYIENKELKTILEKCIQKLPALWALVFRMKYMDEEDSKKICKKLGLTTSNLWVIIHRAKVNLRACISKHWTND